jgi:hypothetical protein
MAPQRNACRRTALIGRFDGGDRQMARQDGGSPMTQAQRDEIKLLCREAEIPDKSGELYTEQAAQALIDDLREKASTVDRSPAAGHRRDW